MGGSRGSAPRPQLDAFRKQRVRWEDREWKSGEGLWLALEHRTGSPASPAHMCGLHTSPPGPAASPCSMPPSTQPLTTGEMPSPRGPPPQGRAVSFLLNPGTGGSQLIPPASGRLPEVDDCCRTSNSDRIQTEFYRRIKILEHQSQGNSSHEENTVHWQTMS